MTVYTEGQHAGEGILYEEEFSASREVITIADGAGVINPLTVLGQITIGDASSAAGGSNTGGGTLTLDATTPVLSGAQVGAYTVKCITAATNSGTFRVTDPKGNVLGDVAVGATFANQIKFVVADGTPDFAVGDVFTVTVAAGSGEYVPAPATAVDGSDVGVALNIYAVDATDAAVSTTAIVREAVVAVGNLNYATSVNDAGKKSAKQADLKARNILAR